MDVYKEYLALEIAGNTVLQYLVAVLIFVGIYLVLIITKKQAIDRLLKAAKRTATNFDDALVAFFAGINKFFYALIALFVAIQGITIPGSVELIINLVLLVAVVSLTIRLAEAVISIVLENRLKKGGDEASIPHVFKLGIRLILWIFGALLILSNLGIDVTSLIAGLGIGGIAISLALQNILSDLFSSFSIAVDKPFKEGDFIVVGEHKGTVKHIGLKTTRIEALEGEEVVISNNELTTARVQNYKKMRRRRIAFSIGVTYDTSADKLKEVNEIVKKAIESQENTEFDRVHFFEFADSSLNFEVVYFVTTNEYVEYMNTQQAINFAILEGFEKAGIEMAYPTQTVFVKKD